MSVIDNSQIAILQKTNELAIRHGIKPVLFVATVEFDNDSGWWKLVFESNELSGEAAKKFDRVLDSLGVSQSGQLFGSCEEIYDALEAAIKKAPKERPR